MKRLSFLFLLSVYLLPLLSQVSHGGRPLFLFSEENSGLRNVTDDASLFIDMPAFDVDSLLAEDALNESNMKGAFRFAHKFYQEIEKGKSGHSFVLADGTKVWQVGIRSLGAYSINLLFSEFELPEGGQLFLYSPDGGHVLGSFTHENNPEKGLFPTSPIYGEEIIIEYSEPAWAAFEGKLKITEINHDYRGILKSEPWNDRFAEFACMPDILCSEGKDLAINRSAVLLIINGGTLCSGAMINNTNEDETPYLLTAMHCFNYSTPIHFPMEHYVDLAGTVVTFFNYNRPVCDTRMRGVEEMSIAGAYARCIIEPLDVALLELKETPPDHYQAYYAGWNLDPLVHNTTGFVHNIHHPYGDHSKYGKTTKKIAYASYSGINLFAQNSFWLVPGWETGSTYAGSSGSPLFDDQNRIIGALSGGSSLCNGSNPNGQSDLFSRLHLAWKYKTNTDSLRLDRWLDRQNTGVLSLSGLDSREEPLHRLTNASYNNGDELTQTVVESPSDYLFGANQRSTTEFAEKFSSDTESLVYGAFLLTPPISNLTEVKVNLYKSEEGRPGEKVATTVFSPTYTNYSRDFSELKKKISQDSESFVTWEGAPIVVGKTFFIGYELPNASASFKVYNTKFASYASNTAWINVPGSGWTDVSSYPPSPISTSLGIQALVADTNDSSVSDPKEKIKALKYIRKTQTLQVQIGSNEKASLSLYTAGGVLLKTYEHTGPGTFFLNGIQKNTVGIISLKTNLRNEKLKIIF